MCFLLLHVLLHCVILHAYGQLNAFIPQFHQHLIFIVYESPLGVGFVYQNIICKFEKGFEMFLYQFRLALWPLVCFQDGCFMSFCSFRKSSHSKSKWSVV